MTMDRVYNPHQQHAGFQQIQQVHPRQITNTQQPPQSPQMTRHHVVGQQDQSHLQSLQQAHLAYSGANQIHNHQHPLVLQHKQQQLHHTHHHQTVSLDGQMLNLHRPLHPPPPPPPLPTAIHHRTQVTTSRCLPPTITSVAVKLGDDTTPLGATAAANVVCPEVPARSLDLVPELVKQPRQPIQHNHYVNTHFQYYQPSNLQIHDTQQRVLNDRKHHMATQSYYCNNPSQPPPAPPQQQHLPSNDIDVVDSSCPTDRGVQDHYSEEVIQAILAAKEALEKPIEERDERDILLIDNLCSLVNGFDAFPKSIRRALAAQAVLIVIDEKGKELIVHNEELDSFCVLIFGECEQLNVAKTMPLRYFHVGDAFGVCEPTTETIRFSGHMVTRCENCAFLCVKRDDFYTILTDPANYPNKEVIRHRDRNGNVVCVSQFNIDKKSSGPLWAYHMQSKPFKIILPDGHMIVKATESCLLMALVDGYDRIDPDYVDDFLLLFRVFMTFDQRDKEKKLPPGMVKLCLILAKWLDHPDYRDKVVKIVLNWLSSYYHDFELNSEFSYLFFRVLEARLMNLSMNNQLHLLHVTLSTKSKIRHVTISRSSREQPLPFSISGGYEKNCGIFVTHGHGLNCEDCSFDSLINYSNVVNLDGTDQTRPMTAPRNQRKNYNHFGSSSNHDNSAQKISAQLRPGDQILEANGTNFLAIKLVEAQKKLDMSTHLSLTVKYNPSAFYEMRAVPEGRRKSSMSSISSVSPHPAFGGQKFNFNLHEQPSNRTGSDNFPPASPLFTTNSNFNFRTLMKSSAPKGDRSRLSNLISSSKQLVKQIRDSTVQSATNFETVSKTSDNASDNQSNDLDLGKTKSNPDLVSLKSKDKQLESGLSNVVKFDELNPASITENSTSGTNQTLVNVLRVFNAANNDSRYLLIHEETTAREVVMVAVKEFNLAASSGMSQNSPTEKNISSLNWYLYEVSVVPESRTIKQKCLSEQISHLAERASLCSRFYIKNNSQSGFGPSRLDMGDDMLVNEILKESPAHVTLTSLNATLLAVELTLTDFDKFKNIEPQQFVYDTFFDCSDVKKSQSVNGSISSQDTASLKSSSSDGQESDMMNSNASKSRVVPKSWMLEYQQFADISNKEMFWVICETLNERNMNRRMKIIKQFIRVADVCSQLRNYNSMFAIISGLGHSCVGRLRRTFEKLKPKYKNQLEKMRSLFDPSRNMSNYRICLSQTQPPAIPLFPQIKKDLTFTKEGRSVFVREPNDYSDDEEQGFCQSTIRRKTHGSDLLTVKSATVGTNNNQHNHSEGHQNNLPIAKSRSVSYSSFNNRVESSEVETVLVNFGEIRQFTERVKGVIYFSSVPYSNDLLTNNKDNQRTQAHIKKMHEEWQMRKRIRHYLSQTLGNTTVEQNGASAQQGNMAGNGYLDQTDSGSSRQQRQVCITYDERSLYQRSLEIEPELNARPQVSAEPRHQPQPQPHLNKQLSLASAASGTLPPSVQLHLPSVAFAHNQPQVPPTAALLSMQAPSSSAATSSPTLSKSSSLSSCSSFNNHHHHHLSSLHGSRGSGALTSAVGKFGTESTESLRKLRALSENVDDWRSSSCTGGGANNNNHNNVGANSGGSGSVVDGLAKNLVSLRIFPPKSSR